MGMLERQTLDVDQMLRTDIVRGRVIAPAAAAHGCGWHKTVLATAASGGRGRLVDDRNNFV